MAAGVVARLLAPPDSDIAFRENLASVIWFDAFGSSMNIQSWVSATKSG